jgi:hypothetical protein
MNVWVSKAAGLPPSSVALLECICYACCAWHADVRQASGAVTVHPMPTQYIKGGKSNLQTRMLFRHSKKAMLGLLC